jgi:hypothetical protein
MIVLGICSLLLRLDSILWFQEHKSIEGIIKNMDKSKFSVPENFAFEEARLPKL